MVGLGAATVIGLVAPAAGAASTGATDKEIATAGVLVASDLPIVPFLADRRMPGDLVDTSAVRFATGSLTPRRVRLAHARVYVVGREFARHPASTTGLSPVRRFGSIRILIRR